MSAFAASPLLQAWKSTLQPSCSTQGTKARSSFSLFCRDNCIHHRAPKPPTVRTGMSLRLAVRRKCVRLKARPCQRHCMELAEHVIPQTRRKQFRRALCRERGGTGCPKPGWRSSRRRNAAMACAAAKSSLNLSNPNRSHCCNGDEWSHRLP